MPLISQSISKDLLNSYSGYDVQKVGLGMQNPNIYATPSYQKKKIQNMLIGGISDISYAGYENDRSPLVLVLGFEAAFGTVIGLNMRYAPPQVRRKILKYVLDANLARIKSNVPMMIDWHSLKRIAPEIMGMTRRYKIIGIRVNETLQLNEWPEVLKVKSPYENFYRLQMK